MNLFRYEDSRCHINGTLQGFYHTCRTATDPSQLTASAPLGEVLPPVVQIGAWNLRLARWGLVPYYSPVPCTDKERRATEDVLYHLFELECSLEEFRLLSVVIEDRFTLFGLLKSEFLRCSEQRRKVAVATLSPYRLWKPIHNTVDLIYKARKADRLYPA